MGMNDMRSQLKKAGYNSNSRPVRNNNFNNTPAFKAPLDYDVVSDAEKVIVNLEKDKYGKIALTTSQVRKFLTAINVVRNKVDLYIAQNKETKELSSELVAEVKFLKVNLLYQAGRINTVKQFMNTANLGNIIDNIGKDTKKFQKLCKYVEALVAYHKFYGGKDK